MLLDEIHILLNRNVGDIFIFLGSALLRHETVGSIIPERGEDKFSMILLKLYSPVIRCIKEDLNLTINYKPIILLKHAILQLSQTDRKVRINSKLNIPVKKYIYLLVFSWNKINYLAVELFLPLFVHAGFL